MSLVTGRLEDWYVDSWTYKDANVLRGYVYNDDKKRFRDGEWMRSSRLLTNVSELQEGTLAETQYSVYELGKPKENPPSGVYKEPKPFTKRELELLQCLI